MQRPSNKLVESKPGDTSTMETRVRDTYGLTARDIKLVVEGGFNTVESIAYTYVGHYARNDPSANII